MKIARILFVILGLSVVAVVSALLASKPAPAQGPIPVRVTNTPLPIQGNVNANVTNTVPVNVANTVPISGTINATLINPPLLPFLPSDTVSLQMVNAFSAVCSQDGKGNAISWVFDRSVTKSGGTVSPFVLPAGKVLVVTNLDWIAAGFGNLQANLARTAILTRAIGGGINGPSAQSTALADSNGRAGGSETFPTGVVLQNSGQFCLGMDTTVPGEGLVGVLQGYLAPDR